MRHRSGDLRLLRRFLPYYRRHLPVLCLDLLCAALTSVCELVFPLIVKEITDRAVGGTVPITTGWALRLGCVYLAIRVLDAAAHYFMQSRGHIMGAKIETDMRTDLFSHLQQLSFSYYNSAKIGQIMARMTSDLFDVTEFAHHGPEELLISTLKIVSAFFILSGMSLPLTLIVFAMLPLMLVATAYFNGKMRRTFRDCRVQVGEINAQMEDSLLGMRVVQSFANEDMEREKFGRGNLEFLRLKGVQYRAMAGFFSTTRMLDGLMHITVVVAGALFLAAGTISPGGFASYLLYNSMLLASVRQLVQFSEQFQRGVSGIERFFEVMDEPVEIRDAPGAKDLKIARGDITFDRVSFHYHDNHSHAILMNISLSIPAGCNVALVGSSGSGKTTLCNLIPRFYDVTQGRILIDGQDVKSLTLKSLRDNIGMVQQDVYLFSGSVYDNIAYGNPSASHDEVVAAAKRAGAHDFIALLPEGYDTYVGERGVRLSGGQKQRVSIARVFLKNPPILLLDEATSALDNESERIVQQSLEALARGRTTLTIAHRLTTIRNADVIWVLSDQGVIEQGTHTELMALGGAYCHMYSLYSSLEEENPEKDPSPFASAGFRTRT